MKESDFITLLVQETLALQDEEFVGEVLEIAENNKKKCLVFTNEAGEILEVPSNWGPFKSFNGHSLTLESHRDDYEFLSILERFYGCEFDSVRISLKQIEYTYQERKAA